MLLELDSSPDIQLYEEKIANLPVTGFNVDQEVQNLFTDYRENPEHAFARTRQNILSWLREYPLRMVVLPIEIELAEVDGQKQIFPAKDGQGSWAESAIREERNGAVTETCQQIETFLVNSRPGSLAFFVSPKGGTGLVDEYGSDIVHPDTQIYIYAIGPDGRLEGTTLIADLELEDNENFLSQVSGFAPFEGTEDERIEYVVRSPVFLESNGTWSFGLEGVMLNLHRIVDKTEETGALYAALETQEIPNLKLINRALDGLQEDFRNISFVPENKKLVRQQLTKTILDCSRLTSEETQNPADLEVPVSGTIYRYFPKPSYFDYWNEAARLAQMGGCAGGKCDVKDNEATVSVTSFGTTTYAKKETDEKDLCGGCHKNPKVSGGLCTACSKKS